MHAAIHTAFTDSRQDYDSSTRQVLNNITIEFCLPKQQHDLSIKQAKERVRVTTVAVEQYVLHILSVCVALVIQHAMRMRHFILSCDLSSSALFFHTFSQTA